MTKRKKQTSPAVIKIRRTWKIHPATQVGDDIKIYNRKRQKKLLRARLKEDL